MEARGDESGEVGHVDHEVGTDGVGDAAELGEVELPGVGRPAGDDELRLVFLGEAFDFGHVDASGVVEAVGDDRVEAAGEVDLHSVGEVAAVGEVEAEDGVAGTDEGVHDRGVGLSTGVRLDVGVCGAEEGLDAVDGDAFDLIDVFAAAVVAAARVALGVLVREYRPLSFHDGRGGVVLRGDHLQALALPGQFGVDEAGDGGIEFGDRSAQFDGFTAGEGLGGSAGRGIESGGVIDGRGRELLCHGSPSIGADQPTPADQQLIYQMRSCSVGREIQPTQYVARKEFEESSHEHIRRCDVTDDVLGESRL